MDNKKERLGRQKVLQARKTISKTTDMDWFPGDYTQFGGCIMKRNES